jgi:hypothetical protein
MLLISSRYAICWVFSYNIYIFHHQKRGEWKTSSRHNISSRYYMMKHEKHIKYISEWKTAAAHKKETFLLRLTFTRTKKQKNNVSTKERNQQMSPKLFTNKLYDTKRCCSIPSPTSPIIFLKNRNCNIYVCTYVEGFKRHKLAHLATE